MATKEILEETVDVIEETLNTLERIPKVNLNGTTKRQQVLILGAVAVVSAVAGGAVTYFVAKKKLYAQFAELADTEIAQARTYYQNQSKVLKTGEYADPEKLAEGLPPTKDELMEKGAEALRSYQGVTAPAATEEELIIKVPEATVVEVNVFDGVTPTVDDNWDYESEIAERTELRPYVIHHDEFYEGEKNYEQISLTYYRGDDTLVDVRDTPIDDQDKSVGEENLVKFGHGSKDTHIVYVRNDILEVDFEIALHEGKYAHEVLNFDSDTLAHSHSPRRSRRWDDSE